MKTTGQSFKMNGITIEETTKSIMANALALMVDDFKYRSKENLIDTLCGVYDLVIDWLTARGRKSLKYQKDQADLRERGETLTREQVLRMAYNEVLRREDLGTLRGFGFSNKFKDNLRGNPETVSIVKITR
jgi:reverse gyrase